MSAAKHTPGPWTIDFNRNTNVEGVSLTFAIHGREKSYITSGQSAEHLKTDGQCDDPILAAECEANGRLIAAAPELLEALVWREQFEALEGEGSNERFERIADVFRRETGYLRPGKDCRIEPMEVRQQAWEEWLRAGNERARAAIAKATGSADHG